MAVVSEMGEGDEAKGGEKAGDSEVHCATGLNESSGHTYSNLYHRKCYWW